MVVAVAAAWGVEGVERVGGVEEPAAADRLGQGVVVVVVEA